MNQSFGTITDLRTNGAYLPGFLLFYLYSESGSDFHLFLAICTILSAVVMHGFVRSVFGLGGPEQNPLQTEVAIQRMQVVFFGRGPASIYPTDFKGMYDISKNHIPKTRLLFLFSCTIIVLIPMIGLFISFVEVWAIKSQLPYFVLVIYFAQWVWIFQWFMWKFLPSAHLYEHSSTKPIDDVMIDK